MRARAAAGALFFALEIVPPPRLIERGADAGVAFFETVRSRVRSRGELRDWRGVGGVGRSAHPDGVSVRVPLTLQRTSLLRAPQPTDERRRPFS